MDSTNKKWHKAKEHLRLALEQYRKSKTELHFLTLAKAFEILVEYEWKLLRRFVESEGLEAASPKMAIRQAAKLHVITDPEVWLDCLDARNNSVHDYFGITEKEYVSLAEKFLELVESRKTL